MKINLEGKVAIVSGGTAGIGECICWSLTDAGCKVATNYRNEERAQKWRDKNKQDGYDIAGYQADASDYEASQAFVEAVTKDLGPVDILVNNAGITWDGTLRMMKPEQWQTVMNVNLNSLFNLTRPLINGMLERGSGRIINMSSINGQKGQMGQTNYTTTKAGIHGFTMSLAQEVARKGITVNTISPGYIATDMVMAVPEEIRNKIVAGIPVGRLGTPEEIAALTVYLCSDHAQFITGADIAINGGQHMQ